MTLTSPCFLLVSLLCGMLLAGCGGSSEDPTDQTLPSGNAGAGGAGGQGGAGTSQAGASGTGGQAGGGPAGGQGGAGQAGGQGGSGGTSSSALTVTELVGAAHSCALFAGGQVKCWGDNTFGKLGLGDQTPRGNEPGEMGDKLPFVDPGEC